MSLHWILRTQQTGCQMSWPPASGSAPWELRSAYNICSHISGDAGWLSKCPSHVPVLSQWGLLWHGPQVYHSLYRWYCGLLIQLGEAGKTCKSHVLKTAVIEKCNNMSLHEAGVHLTATSRTAILSWVLCQKHKNPGMLPYPSLSSYYHVLTSSSPLLSLGTLSLTKVCNIPHRCRRHLWSISTNVKLTSDHHCKSCKSRSLLWSRGSVVSPHNWIYQELPSTVLH